MAGKELTFKLVMEADTKNYVSNIKDSESVTKALYAAIKQESEKLKAASEQAAQEVGKIVPDDLQKKADQTKGKLSEVSQAAGELGNQANQAAAKVDGLENDLSAVANEAKQAGAILNTAIPEEIIPSESTQKVSQLVTGLHSATQALGEMGSDANISADNLKQLGDYGQQALTGLQNDLQQAKLHLNYLAATNATPEDIERAKAEVKNLETGVKQVKTAFDGFQGVANGALSSVATQAEVTEEAITDVVPSELIQKAQSLSEKFFSAAKEIEALGDKSVISAGELRSMSSIGEQGLNELNSALKAAQAELVRLQNTDGTLKDIEIAKDRVLSIEDAIKETSSAFNYYQDVAVNAMRGVDNATQSSINQLQRFSSVDLGQVVGEAQTATRAIQSMGEGANLSTKEIERIGTIGTSSINTLESELLAAKSAFFALEKSSEAINLDEIQEAGEKVKGLEQALDLAKSAFENFENEASSAMQKVSLSADKTSDNVKQASHEIYDALSIKPPTVINDAITALERKLEDFRANSKLPAEEVERVTRITEQQIEKLKNELQDIGPAAEKANSGISSLSKGMDITRFATTALISALTALGIGLGVQEIVQAADTYTNLSARINIATKEGGNFTAAMAGVQQVALATNSSLEATGDLFTRLNVVAKDIGMSQQQALELTKTVTQAIKIGGSSAEAAEGAVQQFIQAMQGGVLRGEEFNSIMEGGYGLAEALARGLGVTTGELRKMAENGELTAERVVKALHSQAEAVQETYNRFPLTVANALQKITTSWQILIGEINEANGASAVVAGALSTIADNLGILKVFFDDVGAGVGWFQEKLGEIDPSTLQAIQDTLSTVYDTIKNVIRGIAGIAETAWSAFTSALDAISPLFNTFLHGQEDVSGLTTVIELLRIPLGLLADGATGLNIALKLVLSGIQFISAGVYDLSATVLKFTGFDDLAAQAQNTSDKLFAQAEKNAAEAKRIALETKSVTRQAIADITKDEELKNQERIADSQRTLETLNAQEEKHKADYKAISDERIRLNQQLEDARRSGNQASIDLAVKGLADLDAKEKAYQVESQKITEGKIQAAQVVANAMIKSADAAGLAQLKVLNAQLAAQGLQAAFDGTGKVIVSAMQQGTAATEGQTNATDKARKAAAALGIDLDVSLNRVSAGFKEKEGQLNNFANGLKGLGIEGKQAANVTYEAWLKWLEAAKSQAEIDYARSKLKEFGDQGKVSTGQVEQGLIAIKMQALELPDDIDPVTEAFKRLGIETKENLKLAAQQALMDYITVRDSGKATAEGIQKAYEKAAQSAAASGDAGVIAATNAANAGRNLEIQIDDSGQAVVKTMDDWAKANNRVENSASAIGDGYREAGRVAREEAKSSTEAWSEALTAMQGKLKASKTGVMAKNGYSVDEIEQQLTEMGYSGNARQKAKELFETAQQGPGGYYRSASHEYAARYGVSAYDNQKQTGNYMFIAEQLEKLEEYAGKSGSTGSRVNVNNLAPDVSYPKTSVPVSDPARTVRYEFDLGNGKTATMYGSPNDGDDLESMLRKLEMIKKSS